MARPPAKKSKTSASNVEALHVAKFIRKKRLERGLMQIEIAAAIKVKTQFVSNWENARSMPPLSKLRTVCRLLGISPDEVADVFAEARRLQVLQALKKK